MPSLTITVPIGLGDLIYLKGILDTVKYRYDTIKIKFHREIVEFYNINSDYNQFLNDIGKLFFSNHPYIITEEPGIPFYGIVSICNDNNIAPVKPNLPHLLCKGTPLDTGDYIVINTKVRYLSRNYLDQRIGPFWQIVREISNRNKIVIVGEREVELHRGYAEIGADSVYSIYNSIKDQIPPENIIDLSVPALGQTAPQLSKIQQDCLIMRNAKFVITLGVGGGFCMATAVANTLGFRQDSDSIADVVFNREYPGTIVTKDWEYFLAKLREWGTRV